MSTYETPTGVSGSSSDMPPGIDLLVTIIICSVAGAILLMLSAVLVILLVIVNWNKDRHRIQEHYFDTPRCKKLSPRHRSYKETVEINEQQPAEILTIANCVPPLPPRDSNMQLHTLTFSSLLKATNCGESTSTGRPVINSCSVNRTSPKEVIRRGSAMEEEDVLIDTNTENGLHLVTTTNSFTFQKQQSGCVPTCTTFGYRNDAFQKDSTQYQKNFDNHSQKGRLSILYPDNQNENDSSLHVITPTSATNHDYVNIPRHASVAHSLLSEHSNYHDPSYINCSYQTSISTRASHACQIKDTRALPPKTQQTEIVVECATCTQTDGPCKSKCVALENGYYVNIISGEPLVSQPTSDLSTAIACTRHSVQAYSEQAYVNVSKQSKISSSLPNLTSADIMNSSLIPSRTILRRSCDNSKLCSEKFETPSHPPQLITPHIHKHLQNFTHKLQPPNTCGLSPMQAAHFARCKSTEMSRSEYLTSDLARADKGTLILFTNADHTDDNLSLNNLLKSYSSKCTSGDEVRSECDELQEKNFNVKENFSQSSESLDIWPPVIPRHTELKYIRLNHDSNDLYSCDDIDMVTNQSYIDFKHLT